MSPWKLQGSMQYLAQRLVLYFGRHAERLSQDR
ncbi:hypothetical protein BFJ66_g8935 [Fusarium oxysporum f. sp. cepae]|uniref:Uncharacterized protein n=1 Tax=Fusarium oxysporum f. sp. cepae TaxID=396571 RepID=A0A3L6NPA8_FUSOX|nr:hypothetical protein BFJ65_g6515 [Fusarium oxysporum f. sp. cepae]RKK45668.1 hypothetical protein BFJ66_g8935 [Fusarium oxysporum f. sp. cepae]